MARRRCLQRQRWRAGSCDGAGQPSNCTGKPLQLPLRRLLLHRPRQLLAAALRRCAGCHLWCSALAAAAKGLAWNGPWLREDIEVMAHGACTIAGIAATALSHVSAGTLTAAWLRVGPCCTAAAGAAVYCSPPHRRVYTDSMRMGAVAALRGSQIPFSSNEWWRSEVRLVEVVWLAHAVARLHPITVVQCVNDLDSRGNT